MLNLPPSYKEHLREMVEQVRREQQQAAADDASPEASILSSVHSSEYAQDDEENSFLSVTPSMLKSSVCDENRTLVSSVASASSFDDVDGESNNENEDHDGPWYERSTFESVASLMRDDNTRREASTFPTSASTGGILVDTDTDTDQKDDTEQKKEEAATAEQTSTGALLQAGTIVAGAIGLGLMLVLGGTDGGATTSNNSKKKKKETTKPNRSSNGKQPQDNRSIGWFSQDW